MAKGEYKIGADLVRIFSAIGVVFIHVTDPFLSYPPFSGVGGFSWILVDIINTLFRVSVPLFIMLSGYLLLDTSKNMGFSTFYKKRLIRVGIPFVFWLVFFFFWQYFLGNPLTLVNTIRDIATVDLEHLYFIFIILELYLITPLLFIFLKNTKLKSHTFLLIGSLAFTIFMPLFNIFLAKTNFPKTNILTIAIPYISYYLAGTYLRRFEHLSKHSYYLFLLFIGLVILTALSGEGIVNSYFGSYGSLNIILMSYIVFLILMNVNKKSRIFQNKFAVMIIKNISATVLGIYLVHTIAIHSLDKFFAMNPASMLSLTWQTAFFKAFAVFFISYLFVMLGKKIPFVKSVFG